jgi:A/G-specific adenine glycosylase
VPVDASNALLRWYDRNRRSLPWRVESGESADPYRIWLSEIMLQQTTVAAVRPYFESFVKRWPTVGALASADEADVMAAWAGLGYYSRARNLHAAAKAATAMGGFPSEEAELRTLPGVGRYTAAAIAAIAFGKRAVVVDGNVERVVARLFAIDEPLPKARERIYALCDRLTPDDRAGDFAQAMMDLGSTICTPRSPACMACPLREGCAAASSGHPESFPVKAAKKERPRRRGIAYWLEHDGAVLLVRRPNKGLLGGMLAFPTGPWSEDAAIGDGAPATRHWHAGGSIEHVFTHFALTLDLVCADAEDRSAEGIWWPVADIEQAGLPTVFAKLARRGHEWKAAA